ncbi:hypothetical protein [Porphyrobacter sp. GA68]|uniref:hypothetical protein n=1 Tax=Porphyrobacter sp. GA68 TaxID=2883480 RepID=UPI001D18009A|nr:hypothetical protein [Porphyrobacter sp. GA68]
MRTHAFTVAALFAAGMLTNACGSPTPADAARNDAAAPQPVALAAATADPAAAPAVMPVESAVGAAPSPAPVAAGTTPATAASPGGEAIDSLPLRRGYYVASDTPCAQASNATLMLVSREGVSASRSSCELLRITRRGARQFEVRERCDGENRITSYDIPANDRFTSTSEDGWSNSARFCPQASLPEPWRDNDISDIVN